MRSLGARNLLRRPFRLATAALLLIVGDYYRRANAIFLDDATLAQGCQWANVVHSCSTCTGSYLGNGLVVTAAHCDDPCRVTFGESSKGTENWKVNVGECMDHPSYNHQSDTGVDIKWCKLDDSDGNFDLLSTLPIVYPMIPTGCERDWLSNQVYNIFRCPNGNKWSCNDRGPPVTAVGVGCAAPYVQGSNTCAGDDIKRFSNPEGQPGGPLRLVRQENYDGDSCSLRVFEPNVGVMSGDSGGPLNVKLPDGTWRQIGVLHSSGISAHYSALPCRLRWIETTSGIDITPCHDWMNGKYQYNKGCCQDVHPQTPGDQSSCGIDECKNCMGFSSCGIFECGQWGSGSLGKADSGVGNGNKYNVGSLTTRMLESNGYFFQIEQCILHKHGRGHKRASHKRATYFRGKQHKSSSIHAVDKCANDGEALGTFRTHNETQRLPCKIPPDDGEDCRGDVGIHFGVELTEDNACNETGPRPPRP